MTNAREELVARKTRRIMQSFPTDPALYGPHPRIPGAILEAIRWVNEQITLIRLAAEPNPWKEQPDEIICKEILRVVRIKEAQNRTLHDLLQKGRAKP